MKFIKPGLIVATGTVLFFTQVISVSALDSASISNTGADSINKVKISKYFKNYASQSNKSTVNNTVVVQASTGGNTANKNTENGAVSTGAVAVGVGITNAGNTNMMAVNECECVNVGIDAVIEETGADSVNKITSKSYMKNKKSQKNMSRLTNTVGIEAQTGNNAANKNTGDGTVDTDNVEAVVEILNEGNSNLLQ